MRMTTYVGKLLNCGEVENLIREEKEKRRKTRLNQVRHYSRENAHRVLSNVRNERKRQLEVIRNRLKDEWKKNKEKQLEELSAEYGRCLRNVGKGHESAQNEIEQHEVARKKSSYDLERALSRGNDALARLSLERSQLHDKFVQKNSSIQSVRQLEKERAQRIASLPHPPTKPQPIAIDPDEGAVLLINSNVYVVDARKAARLEEERMSDEKAKRREDEVEKSIVRANRYSDARSHFELQKEYNRIMDELEKVEKWEKSIDRKTADISTQNKEELVAKQEAIVEELFNRLSIPLVSVDSSTTFPNDSETTEDETLVHHILVSSSTSDRAHAIVPPIGSETLPVHLSNDNPSSSTMSSFSSASTLNQQLPQSFSIAGNETILASHPTDFVSSVTIDLSTLPISEESSTQHPPSTFRSSFGGTGDSDSEDQSTVHLDDSSGLIEKSSQTNVPHSMLDEKDDRTVALPSNKKSDSFWENNEPVVTKQPQDVPIFRNVAVRRHDLAHDPIHSRETVPKPLHTDKSSYLRHLLSLAMQRRSNEKDIIGVNIPIVSSGSSAARMRSPIRVSGLADLKASFIQAQLTLQAELDARRFERGRILSKGTTSTGESLENRIQMPLQSVPHELSTILEVDTPDSPQQHFQSKILENSILNERGITDEPNLTLVGSDSTSSNASEGSFVFGQSFKLFSNVSMEASHQLLKTPSIIGSSGSWFNSTKHSTETSVPQSHNFGEPFSRMPQNSNLFRDIISQSSKSDSPAVPTPTMSSSSGEFWNSCFSKNLTHSSTPLDTALLSPILTSFSPSKFFDTPQLSSEPRRQKVNEASLSYLDSIASSLTTKSTEIDGPRGDGCPMCTSSSDTDTSSAAFNESLSGSLVSFLKHERSADVSTTESFSGLETTSEN